MGTSRCTNGGRKNILIFSALGLKRAQFVTDIAEENQSLLCAFCFFGLAQYTCRQINIRLQMPQT